MCAQSQSLESLQLQECLENLDKTVNDARIKRDLLRYRQSISRISILDHYLSGELSLLCYVESSPISDAIWRMLQFAGNPISRPQVSSFIFYFNSSNVPLRQNGDKQPVFISDVEIVNGPQDSLPSHMRAYLVQHEPIKNGANYVYSSLLALHPSFKFVDAFADWELGSVINETGCQAGNSFEPDIVEGAIKIVDCVSEDQCRILKERGIIQNRG
jgi:hypothetical protein